MGDRRIRKPLWDTEEETKHLSVMSENNSWTGKGHHSSHGSGHYEELSESRTAITQKSRDQSGWSSWESIEQNPTSRIDNNFKNAPEIKEIDEGTRHYDNVRKRKPLWDTEEETKHLSGMNENNSWTGKDRHSSHGTGNYQELSESRTAAQKSSDHSGWPSWESIGQKPTAPIDNSFKNAPEVKERGEGSRHHDNVSPGFKGVEQRNHNRTYDYDQSHSQRYLGSGRSRSRSRTKGRSRSRSLSRGRARETERDRERQRERRRGYNSRSRSRSRSDANAKNHTRRHSPTRDPRRQSYGLSDRRNNSPEKSSQICRDLASGRCNRGSQCRFFHPKSTSRREDDDTRENWRSREADHSRISRQHSYDRGSRYEVSDPYYGQEEQFVSRSRGAIPCKDFIRGDCSWGDSCRFSHHFAASDDGFGRRTRNTSLDKDIDRKPNDSVRPLCKYFAAGKCGKNNCWFSHDDPNLDKLEARRGGDVAESRRSSHYKSDRRRDDETRISDRLNPIGQSEPIANTDDSREDVNYNKVEGRRDEVTDSRSSRYKSSDGWNGPKWDDATGISDTVKTTGWGEPILDNATITDDPHEDSNFDKEKGRRDEVTNSRSSQYKSNDKWNGPKWDDATRISDTQKPTGYGDPIIAKAINTDGSREDPNLNKVAGRRDEITDRHSSHYKSNDRWNGPKWDDDATRISDTVKTSGWGQPILDSATNTDDPHEDTDFKKVKGRRDEVTDSRHSHYTSNDRWNGPKRDDATRISDTLKSTGWGEPILANNTNADNSRNYHEDPILSKVKGRRDEVTDSRNSHYKSNDRWNGPKWDDATGISDTVKQTGWGESILANNTSADISRNSHEDPNLSKMKGSQGEVIDGRSSHYKSNDGWNGAKWDDATRISDTLNPTGWGEPTLDNATNTDNSHEDPNHKKVESRRSEVSDNRSSYYKSNDKWNGPAWNDALRVSVTRKPTGWGEPILSNTTNTHTVQADWREGTIFSSNSEKQTSLPGVSGSYGRDVGPTKSIAKENIAVSNPSNGVFTDLNGPDRHIVTPLDLQTQILNNQKAIQSPELVESRVPQISNQGTNREHSQTYPHIEVPNSKGMIPSFPNISAGDPLVKESMVQPKPVAVSFDQFNSTGNDRYNTQKHNLPQGTERNNQEITVQNSENAIGEESKNGQENKHSETLNGQAKFEEGSLNKDDKGLYIFKNALVELVKDILKPTWQEGRISREAHKTVVKKVVDKVSSAIHVDHIPRTQDQVEQYLSISKPKIAKLVQAYVERSQTADP